MGDYEKHINVKFWSDEQEVTCFYQTGQGSSMAGEGETYSHIWNRRKITLKKLLTKHLRST